MESRKPAEAIIRPKIVSPKFDSSGGQVKHPIDTAKPPSKTAKARDGWEGGGLLGALVSRSTIADR